jgi:hypothetical protein
MIVVFVVVLRGRGVDLPGPITVGAAGALTVETIARMFGRLPRTTPHAS